MKSFSPGTALPVLFAFFIMGFCDIVGISSDYAREAFGWSHTMAGFVPSMVFVWFLFISVPAGIAMNRLGRKTTVLVSLTVTVIGMFIPLLMTGWACLAGYALLGIGNAILQVSLNPLLSNVVPDGKWLTSSLTAGQVVKALSSLAGPSILVLSVNVLGNGDDSDWYLVFPMLGGITLVSALWLWLTPMPREPRVNDGFTVAQTFGLLADRTVLLLFLGIFFVVGIDVATNFVSSKVMILRFGWDKQDAGLAPQIYFFARTAGAFIGMFLMTRISASAYFRANILACIVAVLALAFCTDERVDLLCIGAIGFLCSCIFPILFAMAVQAAPDKANLLSGLMITAVAGGGAVTPLIGMATEAVGITGGVCVLLLCAFYLTYCAFGLNTKKTTL
ncbi:MAG: MFS transporter [Clostridium sp.]|nr:MFS transporter [Clostridium sp.]